MKKLYSDVISLACVALSLVGGTTLACWVPERGSVSAADAAPPLGAVARAETASQYVQEPPGRISKRPVLGAVIRKANERSNHAMLSVFKSAIEPSRLSTVRLSVEGQQVALGAIVGSDGWIATKASELSGDNEVICTLFDGGKYPAQVHTTVEGLDLALLRIQASGLPVVQWDLTVPDRGRWLATTDVSGMPAAVGVASSGLQRIRAADAVLGVFLETAPGGAAVTKVLPGSGAAEVGIRKYDRIVRVDGSSIASQMEFRQRIEGGLGGQPVRLVIVRGEKSFEVTARLMDLSDELLDETEMEVSGRVSHRATGFDQVLSHDTVLRPNQCGGPLVNLDGRVVGLNIARAGRVTFYALPAYVVQPAVENLIEQARLVSRTNEPSPATAPVR